MALCQHKQTIWFSRMIKLSAHVLCHEGSWGAADIVVAAASAGRARAAMRDPKSFRARRATPASPWPASWTRHFRDCPAGSARSRASVSAANAGPSPFAEPTSCRAHHESGFIALLYSDALLKLSARLELRSLSSPRAAEGIVQKLSTPSFGPCSSLSASGAAAGAPWRQ